MRNDNYLPFFIKLAKAVRWLFWLYLIFIIWFSIMVLAGSAVPMNPVARSTAWGRFKWHFSGNFDLVCLAIPLFLLYFFQSRLRLGLLHADEIQIKKGLSYLHILLISLSIIVTMKLIFELMVYPFW